MKRATPENLQQLAMTAAASPTYLTGYPGPIGCPYMHLGITSPWLLLMIRIEYTEYTLWLSNMAIENPLSMEVFDGKIWDNHETSINITTRFSIAMLPCLMGFRRYVDLPG